MVETEYCLWISFTNLKPEAVKAVNKLFYRPQEMQEFKICIDTNYFSLKPAHFRDNQNRLLPYSKTTFFSEL